MKSKTPGPVTNPLSLADRSGGYRFNDGSKTETEASLKDQCTTTGGLTTDGVERLTHREC